MPGFLGGGSSSTSSTGGEITFPREFIDPVTKFRVSEPENLIDTDFEYGLQPTKWETVELINNTPSFFSKSGDTTIPNILSITTNAGTREITVKTALDHGLAVGIPINVSGTKSTTADGSFIINSIPNETTFTYLCKDNQPSTASIEDLYSSIITGEFFQGSQLRLAESEGIITNGQSISTLTVKTSSTHGFGLDTPFYFLNLNSTISQEFPAANTEAKSFDSSNSATAQTFDGSNTLSSINIDWSNSAVQAGATSNISSVNTTDDTITVAHGTENFNGKPLGTPLYYDVTTATGFFNTNPRGVVFLKTTTSLGLSTSTFQVSELPDGDPIDIVSTMTGTFQLANQARIFSGNNINLATETTVEILKGPVKEFDASNTTGSVGTVTGYSGSNVTVNSATDLGWYFGTMVFYSTTGAAATGLTNNTTYFVDNYFRQGTSDNYSFTLKPLPNGSVITSISGGTGTQTFTQIFVSIDKDIFHVKDNEFLDADMLEYSYPENGRFSVATQDEVRDYYFITTRYDAHNFTLNQTTGDLIPKTVDITVDRGTTITPTTATPIGLQTPITYSITSGVLPNGLSLNTTTGSVSGTPVEAIASPGRQVIVTATDASGNTAFQTHTYVINATVGSITPATVSRENIFAGQAMTATTATTTNLVAPITWAVSSGTLPTGLSLNTTNGSVSGTPTEVINAPGRQVIIRATDVGGLTAFQTHTYQINPAPNLYNFTSATFTTGGATGRFGPNVTQARNGVGNPSWASSYLNMSVNGIQRWTVPQTATYRIDVAGGCGSAYASAGNNRGYGYRLRGDFALTQGQIIEIAVGQAGTGNGGGGGGTFVVRDNGNNTRTPMIIAGGGGAQDARYSVQAQFHDAVANENGNPGGGGSAGGSAVYSGGSGGNGGSDGGGNGGAGGGYRNDGGNSPGSFGGYSYLRGGNVPTTNSLVGGDPDGDGTGGFGGGAGTSDDQSAGGGGYSGGGGSNEDHHGGGGGSYFNTSLGTNRVNVGSWTSGAGQCSITRL